MALRFACVLCFVAAAGLVGCNQPTAPAAAASREESPDDESPEVQALHLVHILRDVSADYAPGEEGNGGGIEVEVVGTFRDHVDASKYVFVVIGSPCNLREMNEMKALGRDTVEGSSKEKMFSLEAAVSVGGRAYLCAFAFDGQRRLIGFGQPPKNPLSLEWNAGDEYAHVHGLEVRLEPVQSTVHLNQGWF